MSLPEFSIQRHVMAYMMSAMLILFGLIGYQRLGVDRFPNIDFPVISVTTVQPGANPAVVDASITNVVERQLNSVPGLDAIRSSSVPGASIIILQFDLEKNIDAAFNEVQAKINQILSQLPQDARAPVVAKVQADATPVMWLAVTGNRTLQQLNVYADSVLRKQLENISGVGEVRIGGKRSRTIRVELNPLHLAARNLTIQELIGAFQGDHLLLPGGFLTGDRTENQLKLDLEYHDPIALKEMVVAYRDGAAVQLGDVADVIDDLSDFRQLARFNGEPTVGLGIVKVSGSNTVAIVDAVKKKLANEIIPQLPPGLDVRIASDDSAIVLEMVHALQEHLILGTVLAAFVVLLFLRNFRSTVMIAVAIPVSLLGAVAAMYFLGYTFNNITLLGLLLLIGVVVDDAIVVLENIYRHREDLDPDPVSAAINGTNEVMFAVLAATLSLVSIFLPVIFMGGILGRFFKSFAVVVVVGVMASWFVALTLTPMMASRYLKVSKEHGPVFNAFEKVFKAMEHGYAALLKVSLRHWGKTLLMTMAIVASSYYFVTHIGGTFVPSEDEGRFLVTMKTPLGSSLAYTDEKLREVERILSEDKRITGYFTSIGLGQGLAPGPVYMGSAIANLAPRSERGISQDELIELMNQRMSQVSGARVFAVRTSPIGGERSEPLQFALRGQSLEEVVQYASDLERQMRNIEGIGTIDVALEIDMPQLRLEVDRMRAASLGLNTRMLGTAANVLVSGMDIARYNDFPGNGERYDIRLKAKDGVFTAPQDLQKIYVRGASGDLIRFDTVAKFIEESGPSRIDRYNLRYSAFFFVNPSVPLAEAIGKLNKVAAEVLPVGQNIELIGQAKEFTRSAGYAGFAFMISIIMLYMVLASQFNSFLQPLIIMSALPLAMVGGVAALWLLDYTINIFSMIGLILLIGLVAKNSILLVDLTNQRREQGMGVEEALQDACPTRLRPVLMTSLTVIFALMPTALGYGAGADTNGPLSAAVIGGMITSTLLTLVVVPVVYSLTERMVAWLRLKGAAFI